MICKITNFGSENLRETPANFMYSVVSGNYSDRPINMVIGGINGDTVGMVVNTMFHNRLKECFLYWRYDK